jgi:hypothetical protein
MAAATLPACLAGLFALVPAKTPRLGGDHDEIKGTSIAPRGAREKTQKAMSRLTRSAAQKLITKLKV